MLSALLILAFLFVFSLVSPKLFNQFGSLEQNLRLMKLENGN